MLLLGCVTLWFALPIVTYRAATDKIRFSVDIALHTAVYATRYFASHSCRLLKSAGSLLQ